MNQNGKLSIPRSRRHERGQIVIWLLCVWVVFFVAIGAIVADLGVVYCAWRQLQASTDAAALAGAEALPTQSALAVQSQAQLYGSYSGEKNIYTDMTVTSLPSVTLGCSSTESNLGIVCVDPSSDNVVKVTQTAQVPLNFLNFFSTTLTGHPAMTITANSEAVMKGAPGPPFNVAIIMDTTGSMSSGTNSCGGSTTPIQCARQGLQYLLAELSPCAPGATCAGASPAPAVDQVSLFVFPAWDGTAGLVTSAWCGGGSAHGEHYYEALGGGPTDSPAPPGGETATVSGTSFTYQLIGFSSDYQTTDGAGLNPNSHLVKASGYPAGTGSNNGCLTNPGGAGTYYAGVIYAAQNALAAQKLANPLSNNVMIIMTDGDANATCSDMTAPYNVVYTGSPARVPSGCSPGTGGNSYSYMSATDECQQAILAAWAATQAGTQVYTIGFASEASGCSTDTTSMGLGALAASYGMPASYSATPGSGLTPCDTIEYMASSPAYWFSDSASSCGGASAQPANNIQTIFGAITANLSVARLVPPGT